MNLRKSGRLSVETTERTSFDDDEDYSFASEIAIRILERRDGVTLDDVLCDPSLVAEFDRLADCIAPGFTALQYRWAALSLRKQRELPPEIATRVLRPEDAALIKLTELKLDAIPRQPGCYAFIDADSQQTLYVGEASDLRHRLGTHLDHSDNRQLARHLWDNGPDHVLVEYYVLPGGTSKRELRAIETELIRQRTPKFNILCQV